MSLLSPAATSSRPALPVCLLTTCQGERALSHALRQNLAAELPSVEFTLQETSSPDAIWVCGYEPGFAERVTRLCLAFPEAIVLVTGREPIREWGPEVLEAGASYARSWPIPLGDLEDLLRGSSAEPL